MKREQLLARLDERWQEFKAAYSGLSENQLDVPGVVENWSVKDVLAHVNTWEEEALKYLPIVLRGKKPPLYAHLYGGLDAFNAKMSAEKRELSPAQVLERLDATHQKLVKYIQSVPESEFTTETKFRRRLRLDTYSHYPEHTKMIRVWRERTAS